MKVLVTGAHGQVARAVLAAAPASAAVHASSHETLDIADHAAVLDAVTTLRPDVIVNTAAYTAVDSAESEPELAYAVNALGPASLARACRELQCRLIHLSTDYVFDGASGVPYRPHAEPHPLSVYGASKLDGERAVTSLVPERSIVLRTAWVYDARGRNFVNTMLSLLRKRACVRVVADQIGTPTSARSIARAIWTLIDNPHVIGTHHWTDAGVASWYDFAMAIAEEAAALNLLPENADITPVRTPEYPTTARRPQYSVLDTSSMTALGMTPTHWRLQLRQTLREVQHA